MTSPTLIYIDGFLGVDTDWPAYLHSAFPTMNCIGISLADIIDPNYTQTLCDLAVILYDHIQSLTGDTPILYGYSMGGRVVMQLMALYPQAWKGIIIESAHIGFKDGHERVDSYTKWAHHQSKLESGSVSDFIEYWYSLPLFCRTRSLLSQQHLHRKYTLSKSLIQNWATSFHVSRQPYFLPYLDAFSNPILYLSGALDITYTEHGVFLDSHISHCSSVCINEADHNVHLCRPEAVCDTLRTFFFEHLSL